MCKSVQQFSKKCAKDETVRWWWWWHKDIRALTDNLPRKWLNPRQKTSQAPGGVWRQLFVTLNNQNYKLHKICIKESSNTKKQSNCHSTLWGRRLQFLSNTVLVHSFQFKFRISKVFSFNYECPKWEKKAF